MRFVVIQKRQRSGENHYVEVAKCLTAPDAILFAATLVKAQPFQGPVQAYRVHKGSLEYCLFVENYPSSNTDSDIRLALGEHEALEKNWRAERREKKAKLARISGLLARFSNDDRFKLREDRAFCTFVFGEIIQAEQADARAAELGIFPTSAEAGKAVAA